MDNPKERSKSVSAKPTDLSANVSGEVSSQDAVADVTERFNKAYANFVQTHQDLLTNGHRGVEESYRTYAAAMQEVSNDSLKRYEESHHKFVTGAEDALGKDDAQKRIQDSYRIYMEEMQALAKDVQNRCTEAYDTCASSIQGGQENSQRQYLDAYRDYLRSLQQTWAGVNVNSVVDSLSNALFNPTKL
ncbi:MAG: hypothetical protein DMF72_02565 [Acidobacteria bacterium]|nr:MAG: hypothetical protein DMF72_02565 [Acidobacteriota bacterium]